MNLLVKPHAACFSNDGSASLRSALGTFVVEDAGVVEVLKVLSNISILSKEELECLVAEKTSHPPEIVYDYLVNDTAVLAALPSEQKEIAVSASRADTSLFKQMIAPGLDFRSGFGGNRDSCQGCILGLILEPHANHSPMQNAMDQMREHDVLICVFFIGTVGAITPAWSKSNGLPCPICCHDFCMERSYFDSSERGMSLGDAAEILMGDGLPVPPVTLSRPRDRLFAMRYFAQRIETAAGYLDIAERSMSNSVMTVVDLETLQSQSFQVPFSNLCNCLNNEAHLNAGNCHA